MNSKKVVMIGWTGYVVIQGVKIPIFPVYDSIKAGLDDGWINRGLIQVEIRPKQVRRRGKSCR